MSGYGTLEFTLREILRVIKPLDQDWSVRFQIINDLRISVESVESLRGATVEPYGSFVSDLFSRGGDLDLSIVIPNGSCIFSPGKKQQQTVLGDILKVLRKRGGWRRLLFIANARVPILKCENSYANISCDISISNLSGQMKSKILFWFKEVDGRFRDMVLLVKEWAKAHGINDSKSGSFNSYCLSLLVIFHFQTCMPAIFPPLREIYPRNMTDNLRGVRSVAERQIEETCAENINKFNSMKIRNPVPLNELFLSFLAKFSNISSWAPRQGICLYTGQWESIDSNTRWLPKTYTLFVEDPFELSANTARSVSSRQLEKVSEAFQMTLHKLNTINQIQGSVIPFLVTPQTSQLLPRMMVYDPNAGYINRAQPQRNWPNHGPSQSNFQTQNGKRDQVDKRYPFKAKTQRPAKSDKRTPTKANTQSPAQVDRQASSKAITPKPAQAFQNQEQQVWRPISDGKKLSGIS